MLCVCLSDSILSADFSVISLANGPDVNVICGERISGGAGLRKTCDPVPPWLVLPCVFHLSCFSEREWLDISGVGGRERVIEIYVASRQAP